MLLALVGIVEVSVKCQVSSVKWSAEFGMWNAEFRERVVYSRRATHGFRVTVVRGSPAPHRFRPKFFRSFVSLLSWETRGSFVPSLSPQCCRSDGLVFLLLIHVTLWRGKCSSEPS